MVYVCLSDAQFTNLTSLLASMRMTAQDTKQIEQLEDLQATLQTCRQNPVRCCLNDGQPIRSNAIFFKAPNRQKKNGDYGFFDYAFCSVSCIKTYIETRNNFSPHLLVWLTIHAKRDLKIMDDIPSAPPPELIDVYRTDGCGMTIDQYREFENSHKFVEKIAHLPVNRALWRDEEQKNDDRPYFELIREKEFLAERLYQEFVEAKKPVPKVAGETRQCTNNNSSSSSSSSSSSNGGMTQEQQQQLLSNAEQQQQQQQQLTEDIQGEWSDGDDLDELFQQQSPNPEHYF